MVEGSQKNNRLLVEAMHWRYHPVADRMIELGQMYNPLALCWKRDSLPQC